MRFEEVVSNVAVRYPELRAYGPQPAGVRPFRQEVAKGVAVGRRLHGKFWRETAAKAAVNPALAVVRWIAREYAYRTTLHALRALEDHRLEDIGIERRDIRAVARAAADGVSAGKRAPAKPAPAHTGYEVPKAA